MVGVNFGSGVSWDSWGYADESPYKDSTSVCVCVCVLLCVLNTQGKEKLENCVWTDLLGALPKLCLANSPTLSKTSACWQNQRLSIQPKVNIVQFSVQENCLPVERDKK